MARKFGCNQQTGKWWVDLNSPGWRDAAREMGYPEKSKYNIFFESGPWDTQEEAAEATRLIAARADQVNTWHNRTDQLLRQTPTIEQFLLDHPKNLTAR